MTQERMAGRLPRARGDGGFTLVEIAMVVVILGLLISLLAGIAASMIGQSRREATRQRLTAVETSIALYVSQNQRLPCPANGERPGTVADAGVEQVALGATNSCNVGGAANSQRHGVVPWRALGLSEQDATDGWGNRLTYRVSPEFITANAMNLTFCDPGGSAPAVVSLVNGRCDPGCSSGTFASATTPGCTPPGNVVFNKGLQVQSLAGTVILAPTATTSGAAYVIISHGENGAGAYNNQGVLQAASGSGAGTEEAKNAADQVLAPYYVDDFPSFGSGTGHFDDFVLRPAILAVIARAQLGPRAH